MTCRPCFFRPHLLLLLVMLAGCGRVDRIPTASVAPGSGLSALNRSTPEPHSHGTANFYPLVPGNRWRYANRDSKIYIPYNGTPSERHWEGRTEVVQARMEELHGRVYMREEIGIPDTVLIGGGVRWRREDRTGLYEFGPPAPDSPPFSETRLLAYPLHVGATWAMFPSSRFRVTATVEGVDVLNLPAGRFTAWRIRISGASPQNQIVWYGRAGYLGSKAHDESAPADRPGRIQIIYDHVESLTALDLVRRSGADTLRLLTVVAESREATKNRWSRSAEQGGPLSANVDETPTPRKFSVEGETGNEDAHDHGGGAVGAGDRGAGEGAARR